MSFTIQIRRDLAAHWTSVNPVLHSGEAGLETDTGHVKIGDGTTQWADLDYWVLSLSGGTMTGPLTLAPVALADATTIAVNASLGNDFYVTLGGNRTLAAPSSPVDRQIIRIDVIQPSSGGPYTLSYNAVYDFGSASPPTLSTAASKIDTIAFRYIASIAKWAYLGSGLGF